MNYIMRGFVDLKYSVVIGAVLYAFLFLLLYALKKRKKLSLKYIAELALCIYGVFLMRLVGIFSLQFSLNGIMSYNLIPFVGSSFVPV